MDLVAALATMLLLLIVAALLTAQLLRVRINDPQGKLPSIVVAVSILFALLLLYGTKDRLTWAIAVPHSAAIIWTNLTVIALALGAGAAFRLPNRPLWRRILSATVMGLLGLATLLQPILQPILRPIVGGNQWDNTGVCLQSQPKTCDIKQSSVSREFMLAMNTINSPRMATE